MAVFACLQSNNNIRKYIQETTCTATIFLCFLCFLHGFKIPASEIYFLPCNIILTDGIMSICTPCPPPQHISIPGDGVQDWKFWIAIPILFFFLVVFVLKNKVIEIIFGGSDPCSAIVLRKIAPWHELSSPLQYFFSSVAQRDYANDWGGGRNEIFKYIYGP